MQLYLAAKITPEADGLRLDQALTKLFPDYSRSKLQEWIRANKVTVDGKILRPKDKVYLLQEIIIDTILAEEVSWQPQPIPLKIIYEDDDILIINKPAGLIVHPGAGNPSNTLVNALLHYAPELAKVPRAGVVHRLDKDTSGIMVVARNLSAHHKLVSAIQKRKVTREYEAVVSGVMVAGGTIDAPIGRHGTLRTKMAVTENGKPAVSHYRVLERFRAHSHVHVQLETGRTHQIRVHMAHIGYPIIGDKTYGGRLKLPPNISESIRTTLTQFPRQALHAKRLSLIHPRTKELMVWEAELPLDMQQLLKTLRDEQVPG